MPLPIIEDARLETIEEYRLCFSRTDAPACGWSFPCDAEGAVSTTDLQPAGRRALAMCLEGADEKGRVITADGVLHNERVVRYPAVARCVCGARLELESSWLNTCSACGRDYDGSGTALAPRQHWGEETGEHWADLLAL